METIATMPNGGDTPIRESILALADELERGHNGIYVEMELNGKRARVLLTLIEWDGKRVPPYDDQLFR